MTAADVVADGLRRAGAPRVFVADEADTTLAQAVSAAGLAPIPVHRAASACVMAAVTGRLGDAPGVALVAGDDAAMSRALASAMRDRAPMIVLASREPTGTTPTKTSVVVSGDSAAHWVAHAAQAAMTPPAGCVWLVVPPDVVARAALPVATAARPVVTPLERDEVETIARDVAAAARPLVVAGRECRAPATAGWLRAFAEALPAPVLVTPAARGALPDPHPLCLGALRADATILRRADLVVALGVDDDELEATRPSVTVPVLRIGQVAAVLEELAPRLRARARADWDVAELDRLRRALPRPVVDPALGALVTRLREATPAGTAAVFARPLEAASLLWQAVRPGEVLVEDAALPAALALALARPDGAVLAFGDPGADADSGDAVAAGVRVVAPAPATLMQALDATLASSGPRVIVVPLPG